MNILIVSGCCLYQNTSANLCHRAYIEGFVKLGHAVDLLTFSEKDIIVDKSIVLPSIRNHYKYDGVSLYEKLAAKQSKTRGGQPSTSNGNTEAKIGLKAKLISKTKGFVRSLYGIYNPTINWYYKAKKFRSSENYDLVVSLSYPQVSHLLAKELIETKKVFTKRWIQVWEDPWTIDLNNSDSYEKCKSAEGKLLNSADEVVYVTPITLRRQQELFPDNRNKMKWYPVPSYYIGSNTQSSGMEENYYGYFGDYSPNIRNLKPFYSVAVKKNLNVDICGSPSDLFSSQNNVNIFPRLPLEELKEYEDRANIVICLFNLGGGQIPGKIYQLAATNKTILAILDGPEDEQKVIRDYFEKFNRFVFCQNNEQSISQAIDKIETGDLDDISNEPIDAFSVEKVAKMLLGD